MARLVRSLAGLPLVAALSCAVGCDIDITIPKPQAAAPVDTPAPGPPPETNNALIMAHRAGKNMELTLQMQQLAMLAMMSSLNNQEFPKDWDALIASDPNNKAFYEQLRDAGVIVVWNARDYEQQVGAANAVVAYGPWVLQQGGPVATIDGRAQQMSAEDLKAKLAAMGVEPVEPAPAPGAAEGAAPVIEVPAPADGAAPAAVTPAP
ncbi:MAG TPA: hypothetical protein VGN57_09560 [Pirellulaceae bacterium]|jgi:hypothetical protein|nr:hypothetical protein [Pirellulaceae bacterium]